MGIDVLKPYDRALEHLKSEFLFLQPNSFDWQRNQVFSFGMPAQEMLLALILGTSNYLLFTRGKAARAVFFILHCTYIL